MNIQRYTLTEDGKLLESDEGELVLHQDLQRGMGQLNGILAVLIQDRCNGAVRMSFRSIKAFAEQGKELCVSITDDNQDVALRVMDATASDSE